MQELFTQYWHFLAVQNACKINLFEAFIYANTVKNFCDKAHCNPKAVQFLIHFLTEQGYLKTIQTKKYRFRSKNWYICTKKGIELSEFIPKSRLKTRKIYIPHTKIRIPKRKNCIPHTKTRIPKRKNCIPNPQSWKNACILWGQEHLTAWQNLDYTLKTGKPAFNELYKSNYFDYLADKPAQLQNYQQAMGEYARQDYAEVAIFLTALAPKISNLPFVVADIGGGLGVLTQNLALAYPNIKFILADLPEVLAFAPNVAPNVKLYPLDFFKPLPFVADAMILARVLHDWDDEKVDILLKNCYDALPIGGKLYIFEIMQDEISANLLCLNMLLMCQSHERSSSEYLRLLTAHHFIFIDKKPFNSLQTLLIFEKK